MEGRRATALALLALCIGERNLQSSDDKYILEFRGGRRATEAVVKKPEKPIVIYQISGTK
jgi:hypothetical protein